MWQFLKSYLHLLHFFVHVPMDTIFSFLSTCEVAGCPVTAGILVPAGHAGLLHHQAILHRLHACYASCNLPCSVHGITGVDPAAQEHHALPGFDADLE